MRILRPLLALCALVVAFAADVRAAPGDFFVPAHRTRDGHFVPPNVPPLSAGTHLARRPGRRVIGQRHVRAKAPVPLFVNARAVRR